MKGDGVAPPSRAGRQPANLGSVAVDAAAVGRPGVRQRIVIRITRRGADRDHVARIQVDHALVRGAGSCGKMIFRRSFFRPETCPKLNDKSMPVICVLQVQHVPVTEIERHVLPEIYSQSRDSVHRIPRTECHVRVVDALWPANIPAVYSALSAMMT